MGYRMSAVLCMLALMCGCSAFDNSSEPFAGFSPDEVPPPPGGGPGPYSGYYAGEMTLGSNACTSVSGEVGSKVAFALDVVQSDTVVNVTLEDGTVIAGSLDGDKTTVMSEKSGVRHVYYLTFAEDKIEGSSEVIEATPEGQYGDPCGSYTLSMEKGEKPPEDAKKKEGKKK